ncbi:hypothetical protein [Rhizobium oryzicola]|uniref:ABC transporter permease n=1 Tax=Rhizobium oryzicola TaxID=1232668 RepID=A0ABT8T4R0_9HYPH|nr:hypothetical protein [Rhizobium oryzicola]MDO1585613.1 hypothetical protein [Rhizobium oryzicola]
MALPVRSELQKIFRQRALFAAGFLAVPAFAVLAKIFTDGILFARVARALPAAGIDPVLSAARSLGVADNSLAQLFFALGVASIFVVDYRFATWRHLIPRRSRLAFWSAKSVAALACLSLSLLLVALGDLGVTLVLAVLRGQQIGDFTWAISVPVFFLALLVAVAELLALTAMTALLTVVFRSSMAAVLSVFLFGLATVLLQVYLGSSSELGWTPSAAASLARSGVFDGGRFQVVPYLSGICILLCWGVVCGVLGFVLFQRQELPSE